jgi:hypothetical protein
VVFALFHGFGGGAYPVPLEASGRPDLPARAASEFARKAVSQVAVKKPKEKHRQRKSGENVYYVMLFRRERRNR